MTNIEKIRAEIAENQKVISETLSFDKENEFYNGKWAGFELALAIIDKYAEQEPCEDCDYSEIMDWEQDAKTGKAKPIYWCERHKEPCEDAVSRQAVLDVIYGQHIGGKEAVEHGLRNTYAGDLREIADEIIALPSVRPQEQTGHWNLLDECANSGYYCSECQKKLVKEGWSKTVKKIKFCPNCGAKMVEPQESEEV